MILSLKTIIADLLCADWVGRIIGWIFSDRIPFHGTRIYTHYPEVKNKTKALLFWRMYESAEVRLIKKYMTSAYDVIELGGSIGAVSMQVRRKIADKKLISVEANGSLVAIQKVNFLANGISSFEQVNAAYGSNAQTVWFASGDENTLGKIGEPGKSNGFWVDTMSLKSLVEFYGLREYALVCDIEGAEIDLLLNEQEALRNCKLLVIETHHTVYNNKEYTPEEMKYLLVKMGFRLIDQHGVNLVMAK